MKNKFHSEINYYSIGETTAEALKNKGVKKINTAAEATFEAMLKKYTS
jgi:uroporphyrinogen-III synthase